MSYKNKGNEFVLYEKTVAPTNAVTNRRFVGWDDEQLTDANKPAQGVAMTDIDAGTLGRIATLGSVLVETGGAFAKGDPITCDSSGRAVKGTEQNAKGRADGDATAAGEFVPVQLLGGEPLGDGWFKVALGTSTGAGGLLAFANPYGAAALVTRIVLDIITPVTGAATADVGIASNATTSADNLLDGVDIGTAAGVFDNIDNKGTNGKAKGKLSASDYITASASANPSGLVGNAYIQILRA